MESLKGPLTFFFPGDCYEEVVVNYNIFDGDFIFSLPFLQCNENTSLFCTGQCLKLFNSRLLSLGIILGSVLGNVLCIHYGGVQMHESSQNYSLLLLTWDYWELL